MEEQEPQQPLETRAGQLRRPEDYGSSSSSWNRHEFIRVFMGDDVTLPCYLSPETSTVTMEISWYKGTECIYQYKNGEWQRASVGDDVTLPCYLSPKTSAVTMEIRWFMGKECIYQYKNGEWTDGGEYRCEVIYGEDKKLTSKTQLEVYGPADTPPFRRRNSNDFHPPQMGGESPSLNLPVSPELRLVLLGLSETVKWAAGNTILGREEFGIQAATSTETQHSESRQGEVAGRQLVVVDTPDWLSPGLSQEEMRKDVGLCVRLSAPGPHAFLLVCPLEPSEGEESELLENMEDIFGDKCWAHTMILFTNTEGLRGVNLEEVIQMKSHGFQQLMEKCGNRYHLVNVKNSDETEVTELLQKIEEMVSKNQEKLYSSDIYQEAVEQVVGMKILTEKEKTNRREKEEKELERKYEMDKQDYVVKTKRQNEEKDEKIRELEKRIAELEKELENEKNENRKRELEKQLEEEKERRREIEWEREKLRKDMEREMREKEDRHKEELEEIREKYEMEAKAEAERNLMKIILSEEKLQRGDVSLTLRDVWRADGGKDRCEVISGEDKTLTSETQLEVCGPADTTPLRRRNSNDFIPPQMGGESPSSNLPVSPELRLVLLGLSETVKWAAGNTILGREEFGIQAAASTETQHSESRQGEVAGRQLVVVDTPDWLSPGLSQEEMRKDVGLCVRLSAPGPHTFLLVCPLEPSEGEESELLERMEDIFGDKCRAHTMILFINTEGLRGVNLEKVIQMKSHGFQQLMEKCGNRCHLVNVKNRDETEVTELLQKIEEMVSKNQEKFYSSDVYQEAVEQVVGMKILIEKEKKNRREKEEKELEKKHEMDKQDYVMKMEQEIMEKDEKISELEKRITELEKELENEKKEDRKKELEKQLEEEKERRREVEREREKLRKDMEREMREKEDRHKEELEEIREKYEMESKAEAERNLMKIILSEEELKRGNVSLTLRDVQRADGGKDRREVISGEDKKLTSETQLEVCGSADTPPLRRRNSNDFHPPQMGDENPSSNLPVSPELRLVLLGLSETVKWAAGNTILGREEFGIQAATSTETQHSESRQGEVAGRQLVVVDTPDWLSPGLSQEEMRKDVGLCVRLSAPGPHAFLLVCPLEPSEGEESELLENMEDIFGDKCWGHTMILFTSTEGLREVNLEEVIQMKSHGFQQLMEKCGNRCHLVNVKNRDETEVTNVLQKIEEMVSKNQEKFYSSDVCQEAVEQVVGMKILIKKKEKTNRREKEEKELEKKHEMDKQDYVMKTQQLIMEKDEKIRELEKRIAELEKELENEKNENRKKELEKQLKEESEKEKLRKDMERQTREKEDRHKEELEEIRQKNEMETKTEAERNLMKIILSEHRETGRMKDQAMKRQQYDDEQDSMERLKQTLNEREIEIKRLKLTLNQEEKRTDEDRLKLIHRRMTNKIERMRQVLHSLSLGKTCKVERLKQGLDNLTDTSTQLEEIYKK
ncbi:trichohyalin-like [Chanos chanos]|uniref:Trichohyalin-like n=1 Tax=Chanos chanos TaxID=29144 RepID=A0A6J2V4F7_CHACN|nr:trichohyalin-like [Chanos chanos]